MKNFYLIFMLVCFMGGMVLSAKAEEKEPLIIEMLNKRGKEKMLYGQDVVKIDFGQTITWTPDSKGHNVQFVSVPEGVEKVKSKLSKEFSYTFEKEGAYLYVCTPHASMGMIGVVIHEFDNEIACDIELKKQTNVNVMFSNIFEVKIDSKCEEKK